MPKFSSKALKKLLVITLGGLAVNLKTIAIAHPQPTTVQSGVAQPYPVSTNYSGRVETYLLNPQGLDLHQFHQSVLGQLIAPLQ